MAVEFKSVGSIGYTKEGKTVTPGAPPGVAVGDLLILACAWGPNSSVVDITPTGWFNIFRQISTESNTSNEETVVPNGSTTGDGGNWAPDGHLRVDEGVDNHDGESSVILYLAGPGDDPQLGEIVFDFPAESSGAILKEIKIRLVVKKWITSSSGIIRIQLGVGGAQQAEFSTFAGDYDSNAFTTLEYSWTDPPQPLDERHGSTYKISMWTNNTQITAIELTYMVPSQKANMFTAYRIADGTADDTPTITYTDLQFKEFVAAIARFDGWGEIDGDVIRSYDLESTSQTSISLSYSPKFLKDNSMSLVVIGSDLGSNNDSASATGYTERLTTDGDTSEGSLTLSMLTAPVNDGDTGAGTFTFGSDPGTALPGPSGGFVKLGILIPIHSDLAFSPDASGGVLLGGSADTLKNTSETVSGGVLVGGEIFPTRIILSGTASINVIYGDGSIVVSTAPIAIPTISGAGPSKQKPHTQLNTQSTQFKGLRYSWSVQHPTGKNLYELMRGQDGTWLGTDASEPWNIDSIRGGYVLDLDPPEIGDVFLTPNNIPEIDGEDILTFSAWVTMDSLSTTRTYLAKMDDDAVNQTGFELNWVPGEGFTLFFDVSGSMSIAYTGTTGFTTNTWYHVVTVYNGNGLTDADKVKIYVNAIEQSLIFSGTIPSQIPASNFGIYIGSSQDKTPEPKQHWVGKIDDIRIYSEALSSGQIGHMYNVQTRWELFAEPEFNTVSVGAASLSTAGVLVSGTAFITGPQNIFGNGGILAGGSGSEIATYNISISGGVLSGGIATVGEVQSESVSGGILVGGLARIGETQDEDVLGGSLTGGIADNSIVFNPVINNGILTGGEAGVTSTETFSPSGGLIVNGLAKIGEIQDEEIVGGVIVGGKLSEEPPISGGFIAEGSGSEFAIYNPKFGTTDTTPEHIANQGINSGVFNDWQNASNITLGLDNFAHADLEDSPTARSSLLIATRFKLGVPSGVIPLGIQVFIDCETNNGGRGEFERIFLTKDGINPAGDEKSDNSEIGLNFHTETYGSTIDLWGTTWTPAELNSDNFGFVVRVLAGAGSGTTEVRVYQMRVQVTAFDINTNTVVNVGGEAILTKTFNEPVSGGLIVSGNALDAEGQEESTSGGILVNPAAVNTMSFDPVITGGLIASGSIIISIKTEVSGGALAGGHAPEIHNDIVPSGGVLGGGLGEFTMHLPRGGSIAGGAAIVAINSVISGGVLTGGETGLLFEKGGALIGGIGVENAIYTAAVSSGVVGGETAKVSSSEAFIPTSGISASGIADINIIYNTVVSDGVLVSGKAPEEPPISGGISTGGSAISFIALYNGDGGAVSSGRALVVIALTAQGGSLAGGQAISQEVQEEPTSGGILVGVIDPGAVIGIEPGVSSGSILGGTATINVDYNISGLEGILVGGAIIAGIQSGISGGIVVNGEAFEFITELGIGGAVINGVGRQTFDEFGSSGVKLGGESESFIDYSGHGGALIGGSAQRSTIVHQDTFGGIAVGGRATRWTIIHESTSGGAKVHPTFTFHYDFIGGVNFDDTVSYGGPITIGGEAITPEPIVNYIGNGIVLINGESDVTLTISDFSFESQTPVSTPLAIQGTAEVILFINDQTCVTPRRPCKISDIQTGQRRVHCTIPELFAPYCRDLRRGSQCNNDEALLPAIITCRQKLLRSQEILTIKNKTILRNRGRVI